MSQFFNNSSPKKGPIHLEWVEILRAPLENLEIQKALIIHPMNDPKIVELNYHILSAIYQTNPTSIKSSITIFAMCAAIFGLKAFAKNERMLTSLNTEERSDDCSLKRM